MTTTDTVLAALLALCGLGTPAPAAAQSPTPVPPTFVGICPVHTGDYPPLPFGTVGHPGFSWPVVEAQRDSFDFSHYDAFVDQAMAAGQYDLATNTVEMSITLGLTPEWALADTTTCGRIATNGVSYCSAPPDDITDWKHYLLALVGHFNGGAHPHVRYYELWNEADDTIWWTPKPKGSYTQMLALAQAADSIVHLDPVSQLLTPSVTGDVGKMTSWMAAYLKAGGAAHADGGAFHGYLGANGVQPFPMPEDDGNFGSIATKVREMRAVFDTCGLAGKPMLQTEGSWGSFNVTDADTQAAWLARFDLLQAGLRDSCDLRLTAWFCWADSLFGWGDLEDGTGAPNKAGVALGQIFNWLVGATPAGPCAVGGDGTYVLTLTRPGGYVGRAVWNVNGPTSYTPGAAFTRYRTLAGDTLAIAAGGSILVGLKPKLVESGSYVTAVGPGPPEPEGAAGALRAEPSVTRGPTSFVLDRATPGRERLLVRDVRGRLVRALAIEPGATAVRWDGRDARGAPPAVGVYFAATEDGRARARVVIVR